MRVCTARWNAHRERVVADEPHQIHVSGHHGGVNNGASSDVCIFLFGRLPNGKRKKLIREKKEKELARDQ